MRSDAVIRSAVGGARPSGCLLVNTALELSEHDPEIAWGRAVRPEGGGDGCELADAVLDVT